DPSAGAVAVPRLGEIGVDGRVLVFAVAASLASSLLFGVLPALRASRVDLNASLRQGGRGGALGGGGSRLRAGLVVAEIALAVMLVVGASLLIRSFVALGDVDLGFGTDRLLVVETSVPARDVESAQRAALLYEQLLPRVKALPGITAAAAVRGLPTAR